MNTDPLKPINLTPETPKRHKKRAHNVKKAPYIHGHHHHKHKRDGLKRLMAPLLCLALLLVIVPACIAGYRYVLNNANLVTINGKQLHVVAVNSGTCKGRLLVKNLQMLGKPVCLDNKQQASSIASVEQTNPNPIRGMVYGGLRLASKSSPCAGVFEINNAIVNGQPVCTHGPDPIPLGVNTNAVPVQPPLSPGFNASTDPSATTLPIDSVAPSNIDNSASSDTDSAKTVSVSSKPPTVTTAIMRSASNNPVSVKLAADETAAPSYNLFPLYDCASPGSDGPRVQVLYAHFDNQPDRLNTYMNTFATMIRKTDQVVSDSASLTDGTAHIRWLTDPGCNVVINDVTIPADSSTDAQVLHQVVIQALISQGYQSSDRKYLTFVDSPNFCGISGAVGGISEFNSAVKGNDQLTGYANVGSPCWFPYDNEVPLHELVHALGGINPEAPNATAGYHCIDDAEVMCYADAPNVTLTNACPGDEASNAVISSDTALLDCNGDDYFSANPVPGSYLATHWNIYNSTYLVHDNGSLVPSKPALVTFKLNGTSDQFIFKRGADLAVEYQDLNNPAAGWRSLGGTVLSAPTVVSAGPNQLMLFVRGTTNNIYVKSFNGSTWSGWATVTPAAVSNITAVSRAPGVIDMFYRSSDNKIYTREWSATGGWQKIVGLGGSAASDPVVVSTGAQNMDVYVTGTNQVPYRLNWNGKWNSWQNLGGKALGNPSVTVSANGREDVVIRGTTDVLYIRTLQNNTWTSAWLNIGGKLTGNPTVFTRPDGTLDVFARGSHAVVYTRTRVGNTWQAWHGLKTQLSESDIVAGVQRTGQAQYSAEDLALQNTNGGIYINPNPNQSTNTWYPVLGSGERNLGDYAL
jgi:hypothetical protein